MLVQGSGAIRDVTTRYCIFATVARREEKTAASQQWNGKVQDFVNPSLVVQNIVLVVALAPRMVCIA